MQFQYAHKRDEKEAIFLAVENGQTTTIAKGSLCAWDTTDNTAVSGILTNTRGHRVIVEPAAATLFNKAGFAHTDMDGTPANTKSQIPFQFLIQIYGFRNDILVDTAAADNDTIVGGLLIPSTDTAGKVQGCSNNAAPTATELANAVGIALKIVAVGATDTIDALIQGIM